jgi:hypothetical protein
MPNPPFPFSPATLSSVLLLLMSCAPAESWQPLYKGGNPTESTASGCVAAVWQLQLWQLPRLSVLVGPASRAARGLPESLLAQEKSYGAPTLAPQLYL